jgi:hypothetical protein
VLRARRDTDARGTPEDYFYHTDGLGKGAKAIE